MRRLAPLLTIFALVACSSKIDPNIEDDTGSTSDGGATDGGNSDGGNTDGGNTDGGNTDGGNTDGGNTDGGNTDGGGTDGGGDGGGTSDGGSGDGGGDGGGTSDFAAHGGKWVYDTVTIDYTSCEAVEDLLPTAAGAEFYLTDSTTSGFTKDIDEVGKSTYCTLGGGGSFGCDAIIGSFDVSDYGVTLPTTLETEGTVTGELYMNGSYDIEMDCSGDNCALAEVIYSISFPCSFELSWTAAHNSAR